MFTHLMIYMCRAVNQVSHSFLLNFVCSRWYLQWLQNCAPGLAFTALRVPLHATERRPGVRFLYSILRAGSEFVEATIQCSQCGASVLLLSRSTSRSNAAMVLFTKLEQAHGRHMRGR